MKNYFQEKQEQAIKDYLDPNIDAKTKQELFNEIIYPALDQLIDGVLLMPKFSTLIGISKEALKEECFENLMSALPKFKPNKIGKTGQPVRAYSFLGTCVKNWAVLTIKKSNRNIGVEDLHFDINNFNEQPEEDKESFEQLLELQIKEIEKLLKTKKNLSKYDKTVGHTVIYMLQHWNSLDFDDKNQFKRLLSHYSQLSLPIVNRSLKKMPMLKF